MPVAPKYEVPSDQVIRDRVMEFSNQGLTGLLHLLQFVGNTRLVHLLVFQYGFPPSRRRRSRHARWHRY